MAGTAYSRREVQMACALVFTVCGLVLYGWFQDLAQLGDTVAVIEDQARDHERRLTELAAARSAELSERKQETKEAARRESWRENRRAQAEATAALADAVTRAIAQSCGAGGS